MKSLRKRVRKEYGIPELTICLRGLAAEVYRHRERKGLSQQDFARRAHVSKTTVNDLENGLATDLQLSTFLLVCREIGLSPVSFLTPTDLQVSQSDHRAFLKSIEALRKAIADLEALARKLR
jgi:transcriptional regulator with XRE-family HTH domain